MKFVKSNPSSNFYLPKTQLNARVLVYSEILSQEFDLDSALNSASHNSNYIIAFYQESNQPYSIEPEFKARVSQGCEIVWVENGGPNRFKISGSIKFDLVSALHSFQNLGVGNGNNSVEVVSNSSSGKLLYDRANRNIVINTNNSSDYFLFINGDGDAKMNNILISLDNTNPLGGSYNLIKRYNYFGKLYFSCRHSNGSYDLIQPNSPFFLPNIAGLTVKGSLKNVHTVSYFEKRDFNNKIGILACLNMYSNVAAQAENEISYINCSSEKYVDTNFVDEYGQRFKAEVRNFISSLSSLDLVIGSSTEKSYHFIPFEEQELQISRLKMESMPPALVLLGNSGTEAVALKYDNNLKLTFRHSNLVEIDRENAKLKARGESTTSLIELENASYFNDSQRSPLFGDIATSKYKYLKTGVFNADGEIDKISIPIIPTMSIRENTDLADLEDYFSTIRFNAASNGGFAAFDNSISDSITPQGFKRIPSASPQKKSKGVAKVLSQPIQYDLVNESIGKDKAKRDFHFNIIDSKGDLDRSLRQNEVFLVLTPKLLEQYGHAEILAEISVNRTENENLRFILDLKGSYGSSANGSSHENSIIIIKYINKSLKSLLTEENLGTWSNYGGILGNNEELNKIRTKAKLISESINDDYFNRDVFVDSNWNGVVVLKVPLLQGDNLPKAIRGLGASQALTSKDSGGAESKPIDDLDTKLEFSYIAFPANKTEVGAGGKMEIKSTSFYGLIDYDPFANSQKDYRKFKDHFKINEKPKEPEEQFKMALSKLNVQFKNSEISSFEAISFIQVKELFGDSVEFSGAMLSNGEGSPPSGISQPGKLVKLKGVYQKTEDGNEEIKFAAESDIEIDIENNKIFKSFSVKRVEFGYLKDDYRFDIDASVTLGELKNLFSVKDLKINNIGLKFDIKKFIPKIKFDLSNVQFLPTIDFNGEGFLSSFPIKFHGFEVFKVLRGSDGVYDIDFDFIKFPNTKYPSLGFGKFSNLFSLVFDFDLGTLGDLAALKALKGKLLIGWMPNGGFSMGFKLDGPASKELNIDFGALKLSVEQLNFGKFDPDGKGNCSAYFIRLINARLKIFNTNIPGDKYKFSGLIISDFAKGSKKVAWLMTIDKSKIPEAPTGDAGNSGEERATSENDPSGNASSSDKDTLLLAIGQRVGPNLDEVESVQDAITKTKDAFKKVDGKYKEKNNCNDVGSISDLYKPKRNWLIGSESVMAALGSDWNSTLDLKFIFNDPDLYGVYLRLKKIDFELEILYKKISDNLGQWSIEVGLPEKYRHAEFGAASVTFPYLGVDIFTNGDWKVDLGYPIKTDDWSRSCQIQIAPFVGWGGFYLSHNRTMTESLFADYQDLLLDANGNILKLNIIQAGFAFRIGIGKYIRKGPFYAGASISVYGMLDGAFAFNNGESGLDQFLPDHFVLRGRIGAIAEIIGYVDFKIIKASVHIILRVEFGMDLAMIKGKLQPVPLYIEGSVIVSIRVRIACFKVFGKKFCIYISLKFGTTVRFNYLLGRKPDNKKSKLISDKHSKLISEAEIVQQESKIVLEELPIVYYPSITKSESGLHLIHNFAINFFGFKFDKIDGVDKLKFGRNNILISRIIEPTFTRIKELGITTYEEYDSLLADRHEEHRLEFNYENVLHLDYDYKNDKFLEKHYGLTEKEIPEFQKLLEDDECASETKCPFRLIPLPISSNKFTINKKGEAPYVFDKEFQVEIKNAFTSTEKGVFEGKPEYSEEDIDLIDDYFEHYTQSRSSEDIKSNSNSKQFNLREDYFVSEYAKLFNQLVLQEAYSTYLDKLNEVRKKRPEVLDPIISFSQIDRHEACLEFYVHNIDPKKVIDVKVEINDVLENVIGQLNYFYSSGLRLPKRSSSGTNPQETSPYVELINHASSANVVLSGNDPQVFINHPSDSKKQYDITDQFKEPFATDVKKILDVDIQKLKSEFKIHDDEEIWTSPIVYEDMVIPVQKNCIAAGDNSRFYRFPARLSGLWQVDALKGGRIEFSLNLLDKEENRLQKSNSSDISKSSRKEIPFTTCANIEFGVVESSGSLYEIQNVKVDDLDLINKVWRSNEEMGDLSFYLKSKEKGISYKELPNMTIIKTNLSPRTSPPIIELKRSKKLVSNSSTRRKYVANSKKHPKDFIRILWEGLTTNNGGYYLKIDDSSNVTSNGDQSKTFVVSVSYKRTNEFCNYLKVVGDKLFSSIDNKKVDLLVEDVILKGQIPSKDKRIQEYYAVLPAHCFGFEIERNYSKENEAYRQFTPLEYGIKRENGTMVINRDKALPIMPISPDKDNELRVLYKFMAPLNGKETKSGQQQQKVILENRYKAIGETFELDFGLRDIYGYRTISKLTVESRKYTHRYFDKLVPVGSWPMLEFKIVSKTAGEWQLQMNLDKVAFKKHICNKNSTGTKCKIEYVYQGETESISHEADNDLYNSTKDLMTKIYAQLKDARCKVELVVDLNKSSRIKLEIGERIREFYDSLIDDIMPWEDENGMRVEKLEIEFKDFENRIVPNIVVWRDGKEDNFYEFANQANTILLGKTELRKIESPVTIDLESVKANYGEIPNSYTMGFGSDENGGRQLTFFRNKDFDKVFKNTRFDEKEIFGLRPVSNKLWTGKHKDYDYSKIDIDFGLKLVLSKINELLSGDNLAKFNLESQDEASLLVFNLLESKRALSLGNGSDTVRLGEFIECFDVVGKESTIKQFDHFLADNLTNFYKTDGILKTTLDRTISNSDEYRLSISNETTASEDTDVTAVSSKLHFKNDGSQTEWSILVDSLANNNDPLVARNIRLKFQPTITHIEKDIKPRIDGEEVESSKWIQLLKPYKPKESSFEVSIPGVVRIHPPKPKIETNEWVDVTSGNDEWSSDLGKWNYKLGLLDEGYVKGDRVTIEICRKTISEEKKSKRLSNGNNGEVFNGFLAHWANEIVLSKTIQKETGNPVKKFDQEQFISDLHDVTNPNIKKSKIIVADKRQYESDIFVLEKTNGGTWKEVGKGYTVLNLKKDFPEEAMSLENLVFEGANILDKKVKGSDVRAVLPKIYVERNKNVKNPRFHYRTETIQPVSWVTPLIHILKPKFILSSENFTSSVFEIMPEQLAFNAQAKYLFDISPKNEIALLPIRPVKLFHVDTGEANNSIDPDDVLFGNYANGYSAYSLTIFNVDEESDLPIFKIDTIYKKNI